MSDGSELSGKLASKLASEFSGLTPAGFVSEVQDFRGFVADPAPTLAEKKRALGVIVKHAATLDPSDAGFASAGVALKEAVCSWLDAQPTDKH
jgi:hypothetical protein